MCKPYQLLEYQTSKEWRRLEEVAGTPWKERRWIRSEEGRNVRKGWKAGRSKGRLVG